MDSKQNLVTLIWDGHGTPTVEAVEDEADKKLFFSQPEKDIELGCIGHLRGDFGRAGNEFWTTWWPHCSGLKTPVFADEFDRLVNALREYGFFKNRAAMKAFCEKQEAAQLKSFTGFTYGFRVLSKRYAYFIRCFTEGGDYNFYIYCYDRSRLENKPAL